VEGVEGRVLGGGHVVEEGGRCVVVGGAREGFLQEELIVARSARDPKKSRDLVVAIDSLVLRLRTRNLPGSDCGHTQPHTHRATHTQPHAYSHTHTVTHTHNHRSTEASQTHVCIVRTWITYKLYTYQTYFVCDDASLALLLSLARLHRFCFLHA
jgi:hypothetical protein